MTDAKIPKPPLARDRWALLPPPVVAAILGVLDAAFERRPPFDAIERSSFDAAVDRLPPPSGLTREQLRRAVFEELNFLPWSEGLEPPEGESWLRRTPIETAADRIFFIQPDLYRLKRKVAKALTDKMRADGTLEPEVRVELSGGLEINQGMSGSVRVYHGIRAVYRAAPLVHSELNVYYLAQVPCLVRPHRVFLDPDLGDIGSDEEAERVIRQMWRYGDALYHALSEALRDASQAGSGDERPVARK